MQLGSVKMQLAGSLFTCSLFTCSLFRTECGALHFRCSDLWLASEATVFKTDFGSQLCTWLRQLAYLGCEHYVDQRQLCASCMVQGLEQCFGSRI